MKKTLLVVIPVAMLGFGLLQQHRLTELENRLARLAPETPHDAGAGITARPSRRREERLSIDRHSMAGQESVPELISLTQDLVAEIRSRSQGVTAIRDGPPDDPKMQRLQELLAGLGAGAAEQWLASLDDPVVRQYAAFFYQGSNPRQHFYLAQTNPKDYFVSSLTFRDWGFIDPGAALDWYREAQAQNDPWAEGREMRTWAAVIESRTDPPRAVIDLKAILSETPEHWADSEIRKIAQNFFTNLRDEKDSLAFLVALTPSLNEKPGEETPHLKEFRDKIVLWTKYQLRGLNSEEGVPVVEKGFTPEERLDFARNQAGAASQPESWKNGATWAPWMAAVDAPPDAKHPLRIMALCAGERSGVPEPAWLDALPGSPLKDLAMRDYVETKATREPSIAARWLEKIPTGQEREKLAVKISAAMQVSDPDGAARLLEREGVHP
ncbi:MAG: hypothetical protein JWO82_2213 [Akkermansiaceae bacterium]|nr:hypothetical protein [Akkermansiaceae bacterium]